jgi:5-methylcytosine-specific restriction protein A
MSRSVKEWIGRNDDTQVPPRVLLRIFLRHEGRCQCGCGRIIRTGEVWHADHRIALINGGENRETNLQPVLAEHHKCKTREDVAQKSRSYRRQLRHAGIKANRRPLVGSKKSGWKKTFNHGWVKRDAEGA